MSDAKRLKNARFVFDTICKMLDDAGLAYESNPDKLHVFSGSKTEVASFDFYITVLEDKEIVLLLSRFPIRIPPEKSVDIALAVSILNNIVNNGCFDYNILAGTVIFRMTTSFSNSLISPEAFKYMFFTAFDSVDYVKDKLIAVADGDISIEEFYDFFKNN